MRLKTRSMRRLQFDVSDHEESLRFSNVARPRFKQLLQVFRYWDGYPFNSKTQMLPGFLDLNQPATSVLDTTLSLPSIDLSQDLGVWMFG